MFRGREEVHCVCPDDGVASWRTFSDKMKKTFQLGVENYSQKIHSDTTISQELKNAKVATMDDYFGVNATR